MSGALAGIRVVEFANYVSGPYAGMLLGDLGADIVKVEEPTKGDPFRGWGRVEYSPTFGSVNRNKKSVTIDLKSEAGKADARDLSAFADESFDFVLFSYNGLDCVGHADRLQVLAEVHRVVRPGGVFMFSSHNIDWVYRRRILGDIFRVERGETPVAMVKNLLKPALRIRNYLRALTLTESTADYLIQPDPGNQFATPHYNTSIGVVRRQLADAQFTLTHAINDSGAPVAGDHETASSTLHYLATRI